MLYTSPIPTIVTTFDSGNLTNKIIIPSNADEIEAAAAQSLNLVCQSETSKTYSDYGDSAAWAKFTTITGIY